MAWEKKEVAANMVYLGDEEDQKRKCSGLLVAVPVDALYPPKRNYVLVQRNGDELTLSGSASLGRQLTEHDIGKFVQCEFTGWAKSANGKFRVIEVNVWQGEPTDQMKAWPRYAEFAAPKNGPNKAQGSAAGLTGNPSSSRTAPAPIDDGFDGFDSDEEIPF